MTVSEQHVCKVLDADACLSGVDVHVCPTFWKDALWYL